MTWLLDTNACIAAMTRRSEAVDGRLRAARSTGEPVGISSVVAFELWFGVAKSARRDENADTLQRFLSGDLATVAFDDDDAREAAEIRAGLERAGRPIGPYDLLIAAQAKRRGLTLVTANSREFARVPGLAWEDWAKARR